MGWILAVNSLQANKYYTFENSGGYMDFIVVVISVLVFLFSAWFYTVSDSGIGKSDEETSIKETKSNHQKEKLKEEIVVNYYTNSQNEEKISKIDTAKLEQLTQNAPVTSEQKQPKLQPKENKQIGQTPYAQPSVATVINPQSNFNTSTKSSQIGQHFKSNQTTPSFGSNSSNINSSGSFTVVTPPSIPQMSGMDTPPPIPTLTVSNGITTTQNEQTTTTSDGSNTKTTQSSTKLEGPPQIGQ
jgi:hypothetical protein